MKSFKADLHIHTCLSPCAELSMSPRAIVERALKEELDILGICDHNSAENVPAVTDAAKSNKIFIFPGIEVTTQEEIHLLGLFDNARQAFGLQEMIYAHLPGENDEKAFGLQAVVNEKGEVLNFNPRLLIGACALTINETVDAIHSLGGLAMASHIDRGAFSIFSQLGFIPPELALDALETSPLISIK
ncbi:MAG: PHP domain-containing protein, partial [Acidobacteriota bacterium]